MLMNLKIKEICFFFQYFYVGIKVLSKNVKKTTFFLFYFLENSRYFHTYPETKRGVNPQLGISRITSVRMIFFLGGVYS